MGGRTQQIGTNIRLSFDSAHAIAILDAVLDEEPVSGLTHNFYRYPARFSPRFVRTFISALTSPGDLVLDPFMGGGTTIVEACAQGRRALGVDISSLATFIAKAKTTLLSNGQIALLNAWSLGIPKAVNLHNPPSDLGEWRESGYLKHLDRPETWRLRKAIETALDSSAQLPDEKSKQFARCAILRTAQWALDGRKSIPSVDEFRARLSSNAQQMLQGLVELAVAAKHALGYERRPRILNALCINRSSIGLDKDELIKSSGTPKLIITSPPYPGVHVLYHRWQVDGRKETPAPYWIAGQLDGAGGSYYTMGDRKAVDLPSYFNQIEASFRSLARVASEQTIFVQMIAFAEPDWQLPRYLQTMERAGLQEISIEKLANSSDGRLRRTVPNRKWHADQKGSTNGSREVVLFHRLAGSRSP